MRHAKAAVLFTAIVSTTALYTNGADASSTTQYCCNALALAGLADRLTYPGQDVYTARVESYWSLAAQLDPYCIIQPQNATEVSRAVVALVQANKTQPCQFAVRSGGHTTWAGAANIVDGVTIDLGLMNSTTYHAENNTAAVLPGARWLSVYETMDKYGIAVAGGRAATVGVAGLVLGGGNSFYAGRKGMVCDGVENFEIVLANGTIINANNATNPDLHKTLKGGSGNFGIVTRLDLETFVGGDNAPNNIWGGVVTYPDSTTAQQIQAMVNFGNNINNDPDSSAIGIWKYSTSTNQTIVINAYEYTSPVVAPSAFTEFLAIPGNTSDSMRITNMTDLTIELEQAGGYRDSFITLTFKNDLRVLTKAIELHEALIPAINKGSTGDWTMQNMFQPVPTAFGQIGAQRGGDMLGFDRFNETLVLFQCYLAWNGAEQDDFFQSQGDSLISQLSDYAISLGQSNPFIYLDYAYKTQKPLEGYGAANIEKIRAAAAKYDPEGVFQTMVPGGFKISKVSSMNEQQTEEHDEL
ncbi:FAD binding domain containing protein [Sclerotinia borealis F-4128]|uniref:FAD binding domain containing protein n=1 Tax=Sclerotinia borealis (strain F-4128) TaxID=1432307 RepID=W9CSR0_SCLBF|nr:FAD binding domain containing protein [Sclerotinia borealis F-4128]